MKRRARPSPFWALMASAALALPLVTAAAGPATASLGDLHLVGQGYGHGIGMSQYGAKGRAEAGQAYAAILAAYYPGTTAVVADDTAPITVWIKNVTTTNETWVLAEPGMTLTASDPTAGTSAAPVAVPATVTHWSGVQVTPTAWRLRLESQTFRLEGYYQGTWYDSGSAAVTAALSGARRVGLSAADGTVRLITGGKHIEYRGTVQANRTNTGDPSTVTTTVTTTMANYLRGVVPAEMPASWSLEAVKAQAVAARTYASWDRDVASRPWWYDTCDTTACQVYPGAAVYASDGSLIRAYEGTADAAVTGTAGVTLTYHGDPAFTQFSASNGGYSVVGSQPYLVAKADPYDHYPQWQATITRAQIQARWPSIGTFSSLTVTRDGRGAFGGRVENVLVRGSSGSVEVSGSSFRSAFGLRSTLWRADVEALPPLTPLVTPERDWTGNGVSDLIARGPDGNLYLYSGRGATTWYSRVLIGWGWQTMNMMTEVYNFSGRGKPEFFATDPDGLLWLYVGDGKGGFSGRIKVGHGWNMFDDLVGVQHWVAGGGPGLIAKTPDGHLWYYPGNGRGGFAAPRLIGNGWNIMDDIVYAGDMTGDGRADLVAREAATGKLWLYPGNGSGGFYARHALATGWAQYDAIVGAADWDRDGRIDVLAREATTGDLWLFPGDGRGGFQWPRQVGNGWVGFALVT